MSDLTNLEKRRFERLLGMAGGDGFDFFSRTFAGVITDSTGRNIYDSRYNYGSGSKANRLRAFWQKEENSVVGKLMSDMLDDVKPGALKEECQQVVARLLQCSGVPEARVDAPREEGSAQ